MDLDITFDGKTMCTAVYIKMDSRDPLLLFLPSGCRGYHTQGNRQHKQPIVPSVSIHLEGNDELCGPVMIESDTDYLPDSYRIIDSRP